MRYRYVQETGRLMQAPLSGLIWAVLAPFFYAGMSSSSKLAAEHLNIWQVGFGRFILGLVVVPVVVRVLGLNLWGRQRVLLTLRGVIGSTSFLMLVAAFQRIPLSLAMVLFYLYPVFTALLSPYVAGESTHRTAWPFIGGAFIGTTLILLPGETGTIGIGWGYVLAVIASVLCAVTLLLVRRLGKENNIYTLFYYLCLTGSLTSLGPLVLQGGPIIPAQPIAWMELAAVAVLSIGAQLTLNQALMRIPAHRVSVLMTVEVPLVACFGIFYLGDPVNWRLITGALLIFGCGIGLNFFPSLYPDSRSSRGRDPHGQRYAHQPSRKDPK